MKLRNLVTMSAAVAAALAAPLASAEMIYRTFNGDQIVVTEIRSVPSSAIHTGATTWDDLVLVEKVATALENDRQLAKPGMTATLVGHKGHVTISGTAENYQQAQLAELRAKQAAGPFAVVGTFSTSGG